jgi:hypothetical protein
MSLSIGTSIEWTGAVVVTVRGRSLRSTGLTDAFG